MLSSMRILRLPILLVFTATRVDAAPTLSFPINSQVPPVARVGEPFSFVFSDRTFTSSDGSRLSYALNDPPSWLTLHGDARQLSGTPQEQDVAVGTVVAVDLKLVATDSTGSTTDDATLVVSRSPAPSVQKPVSDQITTFGDYSEPSSIFFSPEEVFKFIFAADTFSTPDAAALNYYSVLTDNSPLPAWLAFDAEALSFAGTTPPFSSLVEPPQTFSVELIASDIEGFSATSVNFSIVVGTHMLTTDQPDVTLNATAGEPLVYSGLLESIQVDRQAAGPSQVNITTEDMPPWLALDEESWSISGTPPATAKSTTFMLIMQDEYADVLNVTFNVELTSANSLFESTFPPLTVEPGDSFSFDLSTYLLDPSDLDVTTDVQPATSWISWDESTLTLSGDAPRSAEKSVVNVTFTVAPKSNKKSKRAGTSQSQQLVIQIDPQPETTRSSATSSPTDSPLSSTSSTSTSTATAPVKGAASAHDPIKWTIVIIVISVVAAIAIAASLCFWCCARKKRKPHSHSTLSSADLADPFPHETYIHTQGIPVNSPEQPQRTTTPPQDEKKKGGIKQPTTIWQASNLRHELNPSPAPAGFSLGAIYSTSFRDDQPSAASTPVRKVKDWFASLRSLNVVHALPLNRRTSTASTLPDEGRSHHGGFDLESSGPPVITLSHGGETSLRDALGMILPATQESKSSQQMTPEAAYNADRRRRMSWRMSKGNSVKQRVPTPGVVRHPQQQSANVANPFTNIYVAGTAVSPISTYPNDLAAPLSTQPMSPVTPTTTSSSPPSIPIPSSSLLPQTTKQAPTRPRRPAHSQKSFTSTASSSIADSLRSQSRKLGRKVSAQARGAAHKLQSPKRRTYAAMGKQRSGTARASSSKRRRQALMEDDESTAAGTPAVGSGTRSMSSPTPTTAAAGGRGGFAGFLSPRAWPQPSTASAAAAGQQRNITVPQSREHIKPAHQASIRRRPVPTPSSMYGSSTHSSIVVFPAGPSSMQPSPLRTPVRGGGGGDAALVSSPFGLGILDGTYTDIANSSPFGGSAPNWEAIGGSGDEDAQSSGGGGGGGSSPAGRHRAAPWAPGWSVGRASGGEERERDGEGEREGAGRRSKESRASSGGGAAYV